MYELTSEHEVDVKLFLWMSLHYDLEMRRLYRRQRTLQSVESFDERLTEQVMYMER
jgi:hypothetical protein